MTNSAYIPRMFTAFLLVLFFQPAIVGADSDSLKISGIVDRASPKVNEIFSLQVTIANDGKESVEALQVEAVPVSRGTCDPDKLKVLPLQTSSTFQCSFSFPREGKFNLAVKVLWKSNSNPNFEQSTFQNISQLTILPNDSYEMSPQVLWWLLPSAIAVCVLPFLARNFLAYRAFWGLIVGLAIALVVVGMIEKNATMTVNGMLVAVGGAIALSLGNDGLRRLIRRITKAGPIEFTTAISGNRDLKISKINEQRFIQTEEVGDILLSETRINYYIDDLRWQTEELESKLIGFSDRRPPMTYAERSSWLWQLKVKNSPHISNELYTDLKAGYDQLHNLSNFKELYETRIRPLLSDTAKGKLESENVLSEVIALLESHKAAVLSPQYFVMLCRLNRLLGRRHAALGLLYEGIEQYPNSLKILGKLCEWLSQINRDYPSATKHGLHAIDMIAEAKKMVGSYSEAVAKNTRSAPSTEFVQYLKSSMTKDEYERKKFSDWCDELETDFKNNVAYYISAGRIYEYEVTAREFVDHACRKSPHNPRFVDTLGYVTFRFAGCRLEATKIEETEKDLIRAAKLFMQASKFARTHDDPDLAEIAELHYELVDEALGKLS